MPIQAFWPPIEIPNIDIWELIFERKNRPFPDDQVLYIDSQTNRTLTFAQTRTIALRFGQGIQLKWKWKKNDVLTVFSPNCIEMPSVIWGTHWSGGIISPVNPLSKAEELAFQLKDAGAKALVTHASCLSVAKAAAKLVGLPEDRIILMGDQRDPEKRIKHFSIIRDIVGIYEYSRPTIDPKTDLAFLAYSSGTTGLPKGVMLTHRNIVSNTMQLEATVRPDLTYKEDKTIAFLPFFHIYGLTGLIHSYTFRGIPLIVMPAFDLPTFCNLVQTHKATFAYVVPPVALLLSKHPVIAKYDLSSLKGLMSAAAPLTQELIHAVYKRLSIPIQQAYGLSETSPCATAQPAEDALRFPGSVGKLCPNMLAKVVDVETNAEVPVGTEGEFWFSGPNVFTGYLNNAAGTTNAFSSDGYFKTGDVGYVDAQGNFYITDRVKELIKYKGFQVAPAQLEGILLDHPSVDDVAVVGVEDPSRATELPRAYIVPAAGVARDEHTATEIATWLAAKVSDYKKLRGGIRFKDVIPKSATGKILRRILKDEAAMEMKESTAKPAIAKL